MHKICCLNKRYKIAPSAKNGPKGILRAAIFRLCIIYPIPTNDPNIDPKKRENQHPKIPKKAPIKPRSSRSPCPMPSCLRKK